MSRRGSLVESPETLRCGRPPCPAAQVGDFIEAAFTTRERRDVAGADELVGQVTAVTPALHGLVVDGPRGELIVGGHNSTDRVKKL